MYLVQMLGFGEENSFFFQQSSMTVARLIGEVTDHESLCFSQGSKVIDLSTKNVGKVHSVVRNFIVLPCTQGILSRWMEILEVLSSEMDAAVQIKVNDIDRVAVAGHIIDVNFKVS